MFFDKKSTLVTGTIDWIIVGLGNPGAKYENTRHNAGFIAIDTLAQKAGAKIDRLKFKSLCTDIKVGDHRVLLIKPSTFMNSSGEAVREAAGFYKVPSAHILILFDDISLDVGAMRIRRQGSDGGHNGIKSIIYQLGENTFPRIKIGVGKKPHPDYDLADWVLGHFQKSDIQALDKVFENIAAAVELIINDETEMAMNKFNS